MSVAASKNDLPYRGMNILRYLELTVDVRAVVSTKVSTGVEIFRYQVFCCY